MKLFVMKLVSDFVDKALFGGSYSKNMARGDWQSDGGSGEEAASAGWLVFEQDADTDGCC